jgi:hypothetical protein
MDVLRGRQAAINCNRKSDCARDIKRAKRARQQVNVFYEFLGLKQSSHALDAIWLQSLVAIGQRMEQKIRRKALLGMEKVNRGAFAPVELL